MSSVDSSANLISTLRKRFKLWLVPTVAFFVLSVIYALLGPKRWQASQALLVRDELIGRAYVTPGRFDSTESLKSTQEIISEIAHNPSVVRETLIAANINGNFSEASPPSAKLVEDVQADIAVIAPGGSEFGKTEMVELRIVGKTPDIAKQLLAGLADQIESHLQQVRSDRAQSMSLELGEAVNLAKRNLDDALAELQRFENDLGSDLVEMRNLNSPNSLSSTMQSSLTAVRNETRQAITEDELVEKQIALLQSAATDVGSIKATPEEILKLLPVLNNLKQGLAAAQLSLSENSGKYDANHPRILSAQNRIDAIKNEISKEVASTLKAKSRERSITQQKIQRLKREDQRISARLAEISELRVQYDKITALVTQRQQSLTNARNELDRMKSIQQAAGKVNLFTRIDQPHVGSRPLGLAKRYVVAAGTGLGLFLGIGLVMLMTPNLSLPGGLLPNLSAAAHPTVADHSLMERRSGQLNPNSANAAQQSANHPRSEPHAGHSPRTQPSTRNAATRNTATRNAGGGSPANPLPNVRPYGSGAAPTQPTPETASRSANIPTAQSAGTRQPPQTNSSNPSQQIAATDQPKPNGPSPASANIPTAAPSPGNPSPANPSSKQQADALVEMLAELRADQQREQKPKASPVAATQAAAPSPAANTDADAGVNEQTAAAAHSAAVLADAKTLHMTAPDGTGQTPQPLQGDPAKRRQAKTTVSAETEAPSAGQSEPQRPVREAPSTEEIVAATAAAATAAAAESDQTSGSVPVAKTLMLSPEQLEQMKQQLANTQPAKSSTGAGKRAGGKSIFVFPKPKANPSNDQTTDK